MRGGRTRVSNRAVLAIQILLTESNVTGANRHRQRHFPTGETVPEGCLEPQEGILKSLGPTSVPKADKAVQKAPDKSRKDNAKPAVRTLEGFGTRLAETGT